MSKKNSKAQPAADAQPDAQPAKVQAQPDAQPAEAHAQVTGEGLTVVDAEGNAHAIPAEDVSAALQDVPAEVRDQVLADLGQEPDAKADLGQEPESQGDQEPDDGPGWRRGMERSLRDGVWHRHHFARMDGQGRPIERFVKLHIPPTHPPDGFEYGRDERCPVALLKAPEYNLLAHPERATPPQYLAEYIAGWSGELGLHESLAGFAEGWPTDKKAREVLLDKLGREAGPGLMWQLLHALCTIAQVN